MFDRIYSIGCFDYFHQGHINLLNTMRFYGKELIIGIHDDCSIEQLKNLSPTDHQPLTLRISNVKKYADRVYVIPAKDPSLYLQCMLLKEDTKDNACYIRADDMKKFPGKHIIDNKISIKYLPYTKNISSTQIRKQNKLLK